MSTQISTEGNLTYDPELRYTPSGKAVVNLDLAVNDRTRNEAGEWAEGGTTFYRAAVWGTQAEHVAQSLSRGDRVVVVGRLERREWTDQDGGHRVQLAPQDATVAPSLRFATVTVQRVSTAQAPDEDGR